MLVKLVCQSKKNLNEKEFYWLIRLNWKQYRKTKNAKQNEFKLFYDQFMLIGSRLLSKYNNLIKYILP